MVKVNSKRSPCDIIILNNTIFNMESTCLIVKEYFIEELDLKYFIGVIRIYIDIKQILERNSIFKEEKAHRSRESVRKAQGYSGLIHWHGLRPH